MSAKNRYRRDSSSVGLFHQVGNTTARGTIRPNHPAFDHQTKEFVRVKRFFPRCCEADRGCKIRIGIDLDTRSEGTSAAIHAGRRTGRVLIIAMLLMMLAVGSGCDSGGKHRMPTEPEDNTAIVPRREARQANTGSLGQREVWEVYLLQGQRVGFGNTRVYPESKDGKTLLRIEAMQKYSIRRFDRVLEQEIALTSLETPEGELIEFATTVNQGEQPLRTVGRVSGNRLEMLLMSPGKTLPINLPWSPDCGGFYHVDGSLLRRPLREGETRRLRVLVPAANVLGDVELTARSPETVELPDGPRKLLRIEAALRLPGGEMRYTAWSDDRGEVWRTVYHDMLGLEMVRTTKEEALRPISPGQFDLGWDVVVRLNHPIENAHHRTMIRYRVSLPDADPTTVFSNGPGQEVRRIDDRSAEIIVHAVPTRTHSQAEAGQGSTLATDSETNGGSADAPTADDQKPNNFIQSDHPKVIAAAAEAIGAEPASAVETARRLEAYVHRVMKRGGRPQAFATAAETAENLTGDCTEYAVFLAALARASGIPSRVVGGLVYIEQAAGFGYHMWTELFLDGQWVPFDATLGMGSAGPARLRLGHSSLAGGDVSALMLPIMQVVARLKIEVVEVQ